MFSVEQRDAVRDRVIALAKQDPRIIAGAVVGSLALGGGDEFSDLDLTFAVIDDVPIVTVLDDWTGKLRDEFGAVELVDLALGPTTYRVLLLADALQVDLSMTPANRFVPGGPRFRLLFGKTVGTGPTPVAPDAADLFGWGVIYALHSRTCIERGRLWQAEHYIGAVRDHALSLACLRHGLIAVQARGYDDLPADVLARLAHTHIGSLEPDVLRAALAAATRSLLAEGKEANVPSAKTSAKRLAALI
ncbi:MAG TPA: nucleotidyltransferase domain-containing protein [Candidatus Dormibacteraeota bacterium]|nr:nucleotidyltransferase domain-containing protein [Candidatus Dormibacteraeota bacterium]